MKKPEIVRTVYPRLRDLTDYDTISAIATMESGERDLAIAGPNERLAYLKALYLKAMSCLGHAWFSPRETPPRSLRRCIERLGRRNSCGEGSGLDLLLDVHRLSGFLDAFQPAGGRQNMDEAERIRSIIATLYAYGCNCGPSRAGQATGVRKQAIVYIRSILCLDKFFKAILLRSRSILSRVVRFLLKNSSVCCKVRGPGAQRMLIKSEASIVNGLPVPLENCEQIMNRTAEIYPFGGQAKQVRIHEIDRADNSIPKQSTWARLFWFFAGAGVKYVLISTPFNFLKTHTALPLIAISGASMAISTTFFFFWNYFVNFRTASHKRDAFQRYLAAVACMWFLSTAMLTLLKTLDLHYGLEIMNFPLDLDIIITQICLAGFKFVLYHKWVFPVERQEAYEQAQIEASAG